MLELTIINSIRTNNFSDERVMQKITELWKNASEELVTHENIKYGVYHDYDSDYKGDYSLSIAIEKNGEKPVIVISDYEKYKIIKVETNDALGLLNAWSNIWAQEESGTLIRSYSYDFEKYYPNGEIEIYIGIE